MALGLPAALLLLLPLLPLPQDNFC